MLEEPFFDRLSLTCQDHPLPFSDTSSLTVLGHYIGTFIEDLDQAFGLGPFEAIGGESGMLLLHLLLE